MDRYGANLNGIEKHLYLGDYESATVSTLLESHDIKYVLSIIDSDLTEKYDSITYMHISADDSPMEDLLTHFPDANRFIADGQATGRNVLVHCHMGISRSATIVMAFLMNKYKMSYKLAAELVESKRDVGPNPGFVHQLLLYEEMSFTLNANNRKFRRFLVQSILAMNYFFTLKWDNKMNAYIQRRNFAEEMTENLVLGPNYLCSNCGFKLFNDIHIMVSEMKENIESDSKHCEWLYIEPQIWMKELFELEEKVSFDVKCPQCRQELVEYKRHFSHFSCDCPQHKSFGKCLRFRIMKNKTKIESIGDKNEIIEDIDKTETIEYMDKTEDEDNDKTGTNEDIKESETNEEIIKTDN